MAWEMRTRAESRDSGFGTSAHSDPSEFIVFKQIGAGATMTYTSANAANTSGTLIVSSGGATVSATLVGNYMSRDFVPITSAGHFGVTDPATPPPPYSANIALLGNYMAASLLRPADGLAGTIITEATLLQEQVVLTKPHTG